MKEDKERWNSRFKARPSSPPKVPGFVQDSIELFNPGSVLDVASGDGAAALFLASQGFETTALDISDVALQRLDNFAKHSNLAIHTTLLDLDEATESLCHDDVCDDFSQDNFNYDNIVICHFKPKPEYWALLISWLEPGGKLFISTFNQKHHTENGFSLRFCLEEEELLNIDPRLVVEHYESVDRNGDFMDDYVFVRKK